MYAVTTIDIAGRHGGIGHTQPKPSGSRRFRIFLARRRLLFHHSPPSTQAERCYPSTWSFVQL